ncbi:hypothetical protein TFLX_00468 [Thermoflexales bacterium]|nr:hypothetical protein TFLX_00468 [Thermoflexales bacterium]
MLLLPPELNVEITKIGEGKYRAYTKRGDNAQEITSHDFDHDPDKLIHIEPQWMLERSVRTVAESLRTEAASTDRPPDDKLLIDYGQRLYAYLFGDGTKLRNFLEFNDAYRSEARLILRLHPEAAALWSLPWEYLHDGAEFMGLNGRLLILRMPHGLAELHPVVSAPPLRILVIIAAPDDQAELDVERELAVMQDALDDMRRVGQVQVDYLEDVTLAALQDKLSAMPYHVLHFTGHGAFIGAEGKLCFEDPMGRSDLIGPQELRPLLTGQRDLRLIVLSACQSAKTSGADAFDSVATGLLQANLPAVLAMQFSILDESAIELARVFYAELARGHAPEEALRQTRLALRRLDEARPADARRFDWGVPALYVRAPGLRLIDPDRPVETLQATSLRRDLGGLTLPRYFAGRRTELRQLRRALRERVPVYVRGIGGIGKTTVIAKLLERPGVELDAPPLVIRCHELSQPVDALGKIASFWQAQGKAGHAEAAALLLSSGREPADRAREALQLIANRRYVIVFDNLESWLEQAVVDSNQSAVVRDAVMREVLRGFLSTYDIHTTFLFTGRHRWTGVEALPPGNRVDIHLPGLTRRQAILLMNAMPRLKAAPLSDKLAAFDRVGGHPKTIELLDGWLGTGRTLHALLNDPSLSDLLDEQWEGYFLNELLARLSPAERDALTTLAILDKPFWWEMVSNLIAGANHYSPPPDMHFALAHFLDLSLIQLSHIDDNGDAFYTLHPVVSEYLLHQLTADQRNSLHLCAAAYYSVPFVEAARQYTAQSGETLTDEEIELLARSSRGIVSAFVRQTQDMQRAHWSMDRALQWQHHLFKAGRVDVADNIVNNIWLVLDRWGQRDLAKTLLRRSVDSLDGPNRAVAQSNLAKLLVDEGRLAEALQVYEEVYRTFIALDAKSQIAAVLSQIGIIYKQQGDLSRAIEKQQSSLEIQREISNEEGQAIGLHRLSMLYRMKEDYDEALAYSKQAVAIDRKRGDMAGLATDLHEQGIIYVLTNRKQDALECFNESLNIKRQIGNESGVASSLGELGNLYTDAGMIREAIVAFREAMEIYQRQGDPKMGQILEGMGIVHEVQGEYTAALEKYQQAKQILQQSYPVGLPIIEQHIARVLGKTGR